MVRTDMRSKLFSLSMLIICSTLPLPLGAQAQTKQSVRDGVFTDAQAERGSGQYTQHCAMCHGAVLEGNGEAPPLTGEFIPDWAGTTLADLYDKISLTMPLSAPGTLRPAVTADILAFILKSNNFPAGSKELGSDTDALKTISFDALAAKTAAKTKTTPK
jgi:mono/diheme cytochrome c family protein